MNEKTKKNIEHILGFCVIILVLLITYYVAVSDVFSETNKTVDKGYVHNVSLMISGMDWTDSFVSENTSNVTVSALLFEWAAHNNISIETQYWSGYDSYLITSIGNNSNGKNNFYWQYYVNDEYADVGCSSYVLNDNDVVLWQYESSKW